MDSGEGGEKKASRGLRGMHESRMSIADGSHGDGRTGPRQSRPMRTSAVDEVWSVEST